MSESNASSAMIKRLEEEGEVGADYLEDLLDIVDLGGDIDIDIDHGRASIAVVAAEAGTSATSPISSAATGRSSRPSRS